LISTLGQFSSSLRYPVFPNVQKGGKLEKTAEKPGIFLESIRLGG
jgi:hypothetical protein